MLFRSPAAITKLNPTKFRSKYVYFLSINSSISNSRYTRKPRITKHLRLGLHMSRRSLRGSSTTSLIRRKKKTASLPSINLWSYVRAMYIIGLGTTFPPTTIGRLTIECIPNIADCQRKVHWCEILFFDHVRS